MVQGNGPAFAGLRRKPLSCKQKKARLLARRQEERASERQLTGDETAALKWWERGLAHADERLVRTRLAISRGRKRCHVRLLLHILAPPVVEGGRRRANPTPAERREAQLCRQVEGGLCTLRRSCQTAPREAMALWRSGTLDATSAVCALHHWEHALLIHRTTHHSPHHTAHTTQSALHHTPHIDTKPPHAAHHTPRITNHTAHHTSTPHTRPHL